MNTDKHACILIFKVFHYVHNLQIYLLNCRELITTKLVIQIVIAIILNGSYKNTKKFIQSRLHKKHLSKFERCFYYIFYLKKYILNNIMIKKPPTINMKVYINVRVFLSFVVLTSLGSSPFIKATIRS